MTAQVMERNGRDLGAPRDWFGLGPAKSAAMEDWANGATAPDPRAPARRRAVNWSRVRGDAGMLAALALVNGFAVHGQALWALEQFRGGLVVAVLFACAVESISLYLQAAAHRARIAGDAALLRLAASYAIGGLVGWLNWSHWADENPARGATYAAFSVLSPMLWAIRSKDTRRDALREAGLIDPRAVRFAPIRWVLYPRRTFRAFRAAVGEGVQDPQVAWALIPAKQPAAPAPVEPIDPRAVRFAPIRWVLYPRRTFRAFRAAVEPAAVPVTVEVTPVSQPPAAAVAAPLIAVPGPAAPLPPKAPARPTRQTRTTTTSGELRAATDEEVLTVTREVLTEKPTAGRVTVTRALATAGYRPGDKARLDRLIAQARGEKQQ